MPFKSETFAKLALPVLSQRPSTAVGFPGCAKITEATIDKIQRPCPNRPIAVHQAINMGHAPMRFPPTINDLMHAMHRGSRELLILPNSSRQESISPWQTPLSPPHGDRASRRADPPRGR